LFIYFINLISSLWKSTFLKIKLKKETNIIDEFVIDACKILAKYFNYVIVSGYLSILFGKIRGTEDIDVFIEKTDFQTFKRFYDELTQKGYEIFNAKSDKDAYNMLTKKIAPRIAKKDEFIPNVELQFPKDNWGLKSIKEKIKVELNEEEFFISSIEMNIAFKIYLSSRKDIDDACYLYLLFKKLRYLDEKKIREICSHLGVSSDILEKCKNG